MRTSQTAASPSVIARVIAILNLFNGHRLAISVDDIAGALTLSAASAYRYAGELLAAGLLVKDASGFRLGPKIIELEYLISSFDPVLRSAQPVMTKMAKETGYDTLLCNVYGSTIVNVLHVRGKNSVFLTYTKGLPMPLFRGAQAIVVLAHMDRRRLKRLYERAIAEPQLAADVMRIGHDWSTFSATLKAVRLRGFHVARGELNKGVVGIAAPVLGADEEIIGSLVITLPARSNAPQAAKELELATIVTRTASTLSRLIQASASQGAGAVIPKGANRSGQHPSRLAPRADA